MKEIILSVAIILLGFKISYAQFTICERCGEQKQGNLLIIEGENKGNWTVKYNLLGHTTSFISPTNEKFSLKNTGDKRDNTDGTTSRTTSSEDGVWQAEIYYKGHAFVKAVLSKR